MDEIEDRGWHHCHFCGEDIDKAGQTTKGDRHFLSDCRPDLVKHDPGSTCTWPGQNGHGQSCYAYQDHGTNEWTDEHIHFYKDGPM